MTHQATCIVCSQVTDYPDDGPWPPPFGVLCGNCLYLDCCEDAGGAGSIRATAHADGTFSIYVGEFSDATGVSAAQVAQFVTFLARYLPSTLLKTVLKSSDPQSPDSRLQAVSLSQVIAPEVLRGFRAMACALTAPQAEHPDVRAACEWLAADSDDTRTKHITGEPTPI